MESDKFPMRINKYLSLKKYSSRREADHLIENRLVRINGRVAKLGDKVYENDKVTVSSIVTERMKKLVYFAYNKPRGIVTHSPEEEQEAITDVIDKLNIGLRVFPVGRLDRSSRGLIILTNDGRITDRLLNPKYEHEKEYIVKVNKPLEKHFVKHLASGIDIEGYKTKPAKVKQISETVFSLVLGEGKKHQIRRMCAAFGYGVADLARVRIMNVKLKDLKERQFRKIEGEELKEFLKKLEL